MPLLAVMSASAKPTGASLKVKVMVAVCPNFKAAVLLEISRVGGTMSSKLVTIVANWLFPVAAPCTTAFMAF